MRVLRHVAPWGLALGLLACDDATNVTSPKADLGTGGSFGGSSGTADASTGGAGGGGGQGSGGTGTGDATTGGAGGAGSGDARVPFADANPFPKPDGNLPGPDAHVGPPDPDAGGPRLDGSVVRPPDAGGEPLPDANIVPPADAGPPPADGQVLPPVDGGGTPPGALRLTRARIVWTVGPLGTGQPIGSTNTSRNGFLRLTGRILFATGGQQP